ncbi:acetylxylan esterase [Porphyromonadaceae bacterium]
MKQFILMFSCFFAAISIAAQGFTPNYDESKVPAYTLPALLVSESGKKIASSEEWERVRRPELMKIFADQMYGAIPSDPSVKSSYQLTEESANALGGKAIRKQIKLTMSNGRESKEAILLIYVPKRKQGEKVPVMLGLNFQGNQTVDMDEAIIPTDVWGLKDKTSKYPRGAQSTRWCAEYLIDNGFALVTACYHNFYPDDPSMEKESNSSSQRLSKEQRTPKHLPLPHTTWFESNNGLYRTRTLINPKQVVLTVIPVWQCLWAGASDGRYATAVSNNSAAGGAAVKACVWRDHVRITTAFPHWFCLNYNQYANKEASMSFDQHQLLALIAPRPLYVAGATDDQWADPKGEFLAARETASVYSLYSLPAITESEQPRPENPLHTTVGYHLRTGKHDVTLYDWQQYVTFAKYHFDKESK